MNPSFRRSLVLLFGLAVLVPSKDCFGVEAQNNKIGTSAQIADSDGDGLFDAEDAHPYVANIQGVSWSIGTLTVGWNVDSSITQLETTLSQSEQAMIKQSELRFGAGMAGSTEAGVDVRSKLSGDPLKLFGLRDSGAEMRFQAKFAASGDMNWSKSDQNKATSLKSLVEQTQIASKLSGLNLEFTVQFYNYGDTDFIGRNLQVPIKAGSSVVTYAQPWGANGPEVEIRIPEQRNRAIPIRFRAQLDTTQSLVLLKTMAEKPPTISIEETQGTITSKLNGQEIDAIAALVQMERKTCKVSAISSDRNFTWRTAKRDEQAGKPLHLADVFAALNALAKERGEGSAKLFQYTKNHLRSALGKDCSLIPIRWWKMDVDDNKDQDVDPSVELGEEIQLSFQDRFPKQMSRWLAINDTSDAWSLAVVAKLLGQGIDGVEQDERRAIEYTKKAAASGEPSALYALGCAHLHGLWGLKVDEARGLQMLEESSVAPALVDLGGWYFYGLKGLPADERRGVELWKKAADNGDAKALSLLGNMYFYGRGDLRSDLRKAKDCWEKAAKAGMSMRRTC